MMSGPECWVSWFSPCVVGLMCSDTLVPLNLDVELGEVVVADTNPEVRT